MTKNKNLHIIAFDIPFPADYGGVMDVFYKIKALAEAGFHITLHAFQYRERSPQAELEKYCSQVHYYPRNLSPFKLLRLQPFIVASRASRQLLKNLKADDAPILFEGLHTCAFIDAAILSAKTPTSNPQDSFVHRTSSPTGLPLGEERGRQKIIRMHNVEWEYYRDLKKTESSWLKRLYFKLESWKLRRFEAKAVAHATALLTISPDDTSYFEELTERLSAAKTQVQFVPPFHPNAFVESRTGRGDYVLFHGKLSVSDNEEAAIYLIKKVFAQHAIPLSIAGKNPSERLLSLAKQYEHITIIPNPTESEMNALIQNAQINVLLSFQRSGMKLKLLNALFRGRYCVVNRHMVQNTGLESLCYVKNTSKDLRATIESLMNVQFSQKQIEERREILERQFANKQNAAHIAAILRG
jgi:hypothetical protein